MLATFIIIIFSIFFTITGVAYLIAWQSHRDPNIFGAVIVMWIIITLFLLAIYFGGKSRQPSQPAETGFVPCKIISEV